MYFCFRSYNEKKIQFMTLGEKISKNDIYKIDLEEFLEEENFLKYVAFAKVEDHSSFTYIEKERRRRISMRGEVYQ